jgi:hypothetical protein
VSAGDYVVWRKTVGSNTNLQADGSGPTVGTPDRIVDQADYNYWRANFGFIGAISGTGTGFGASESLVVSVLNDPPTSRAVATQPSTHSASHTVVDAALVDFNPLHDTASGSTSQTTFYSASPSRPASSIVSLLSIVRLVPTGRSAVESTTSSTDSFDATHDAVDKLLAAWEAAGVDDSLRLFGALV